MFVYQKDVTDESLVGTEAVQAVSPSTHYETTTDSKHEMLQETMWTDVDQTHSNKNWFAMQTDLILKAEAAVIDNHQSNCPEKEFTKDHIISPTRASSIFVSAYTEAVQPESLSSSAKQFSFLSNNTKIIKSAYGWENLSPTAASTFQSFNVINTYPTGVSKMLRCNNRPNHGKPVSSTEDFTSASPSLDASAIPVEDVNKVMLTSRQLDTKNNVEPTKETGNAIVVIKTVNNKHVSLRF